QGLLKQRTFTDQLKKLLGARRPRHRPKTGTVSTCQHYRNNELGHGILKSASASARKNIERFPEGLTCPRHLNKAAQPDSDRDFPCGGSQPPRQRCLCFTACTRFNITTEFRCVSGRTKMIENIVIEPELEPINISPSDDVALLCEKCRGIAIITQAGQKPGARLCRHVCKTPAQRSAQRQRSHQLRQGHS